METNKQILANTIKAMEITYEHQFNYITLVNMEESTAMELTLLLWRLDQKNMRMDRQIRRGNHRISWRNFFCLGNNST